jgi:hypothetical protein
MGVMGVIQSNEHSRRMRLKREAGSVVLLGDPE